MNYEKNKRDSLKIYKLILSIVTIVIFALAIGFSTKNTPFWQFNVVDIIILLVSLLLISLFIERTVEVLMIVWRDKGRQQLINEVDLAKKNCKQGSDDFEAQSKNLNEAIRKLDSYSAETKTLAIPTAFALGIIISALGIRVIQPLVDPAVFQGLTDLQKRLFTGIDTLITGALLGGGSKGIHEIIEAFLNTVEKYRVYLKK